MRGPPAPVALAERRERDRHPLLERVGFGRLRQDRHHREVRDPRKAAGSRRSRPASGRAEHGSKPRFQHCARGAACVPVPPHRREALRARISAKIASAVTVCASSREAGPAPPGRPPRHGAAGGWPEGCAPTSTSTRDPGAHIFSRLGPFGSRSSQSCLAVSELPVRRCSRRHTAEKAPRKAQTGTVLRSMAGATAPGASPCEPSSARRGMRATERFRNSSRSRFYS